jgi:hypothetical protein
MFRDGFFHIFLQVESVPYSGTILFQQPIQASAEAGFTGEAPDPLHTMII